MPSAGGSLTIRPARPADAEPLATLVAQYMRERHPDHPGATAAELRRDVLDNPLGQRVLLAQRGDAPIGFVA